MVTQQSPDPAADRFLDKLLGRSKQITQERRAAKAAEAAAKEDDVLGASLAEMGEPPETVKMLTDESDPVAAIGKFLRQKLLKGV